MRWKNEYYEDWHREFALLPVNINGESVWLEFYEMRYVKFDIPKDHVIGKFEYRFIDKK